MVTDRFDVTVLDLVADEIGFIGALLNVVVGIPDGLEVFRIVFPEAAPFLSAFTGGSLAKAFRMRIPYPLTSHDKPPM